MKYSKITRGTGDTGTTHLSTLERVNKTHPRIMAVGKLDTFHAVLGLCHQHLNLSIMDNVEISGYIISIQETLIKLMGEISANDEKSYAKRFQVINAVDIASLDSMIAILGNILDSTKDPLRDWALYGTKGAAAAQLDYAGALCRECELSIWSLSEECVVRQTIKTYLNRLSKVIYLMARYMEK